MAREGQNRCIRGQDGKVLQSVQNGTAEKGTDSGYPIVIFDWTTPEGESARQEILRSYPFSDPHLREQLDRLAGLAANICQTGTGLVSLVADRQQYFIGKSGIERTGTRRELSFCAQAMHLPDLTIIPDAATDAIYKSNPLVTGEPFIRFYAGQPLVSPEGAPLGTLCVIDTEPRANLSPDQRTALGTLAVAVMGLLERARVEASSKRDIADSQTQYVDMERRFDALADAIPQLVWSTDANGMVDYLNTRWCNFTGTAESESFGESWLNLVHPDDIESASTAWREAHLGRHQYETEYRLRHVDGGYRWVLARGLPVLDEDGSVTRWIGTCTDINEQVAENERMEMLSHELSHRIKNIFAVISGLVGMSARGIPEAQHLSDDLQSRILALGRAHDFVRPHDAEMVEGEDYSSLMSMLGQLLAPYRSEVEARIVIKGGDARIDDRSATPLALFYHELATNAAKYGALSMPEGRVELTITPGEICLLDWREEGGPFVTRPATMGFGHRLMELAVTRQLGGTLELDWQADGLVARARVPASALYRS